MVLGEFAFAAAFALAVWAAYPGRDVDGLVPRAGRWLGAVSYSIYLTHVPLLPILLTVAAGFAVGPDWLAAALVVPAGCLLAYPFHVAFERPFLGRSPGRPSVSIP
jgi:peptidoglycan/LPS O-acetylase OafA/YrhL